jgi:hypothetical protein
MTLQMKERDLRRLGLGHLLQPSQENGKKTNKFNAEKVIEENKTFDSKHEKRRYDALLQMQRIGLIQDLKTQVKFDLVPKVRYPAAGKTSRGRTYIADFTYMKDGELVVEDAKSKITAQDSTYSLKKHLMMHIHGIEIIEV